MKEFWDFDEDINFTEVIINNKKYKVLYKYKDYTQAVKILAQLDITLLLICEYLNTNKYKYPKEDQIAIECFLDIHFNNKNSRLSEMQLGTIFNGLNKPKEVHKTNKPYLGSDKNLRAKYRNVFLTLRRKDGKFKSNKSIIDLFIHEITHTMCNHVTWREDDHSEDFQKYEKLIKQIFLKINSDYS